MAAVSKMEARGAVSSLMADFNSFRKTHPREAFGLMWFTLLGSRQFVAYGLRLLRKTEEKEEKVNFRGDKFTQTQGGPLSLSLLAAFEYWVPTLIRISEAYAMHKVGHKFFSEGDPATLKLANVLTVVFGVLPILENIVPLDWTNPTKKQQRESNVYDRRYRYVLYVWTAVEVYTTIKTISFVVDPKAKFRTSEKVAIVILLGIFNGVFGINFSHELIHKSSKFEKFLAYVLLMNVNYMHWGEEHLTGHHKHVATPEDPASAKLNQSLYSFLPQTLIGSWFSAVNLEMERLKKLGKSKWSLHNRVFGYVALPAIWSFTIGKLFTKNTRKAMGYFYLQGLVSVLLLELVNYVEHYGLSRKKLPNGKYEPVNPVHSWNAAHRLTNAALVKLQRHSDHHTFASRPYHLLRNFSESPQLPSGYAGMLALSVVPPAWKWIMNPLVAANKANFEKMQQIMSEDENQPFRKEEPLLKAERTATLKMVTFQLFFLFAIIQFRMKIVRI